MRNTSYADGNVDVNNDGNKTFTTSRGRLWPLQVNRENTKKREIYWLHVIVIGPNIKAQNLLLSVAS